jgi:hypothetical protein
MFCTPIPSALNEVCRSHFTALHLFPSSSKQTLMVFEQFRSLPKDMQRNVVKHCGVFLFGRTGVGVNVKLYQVDSFYVEIYFNDKMSEATKIRCFEDTRHLEPYLRMIDVSELQPLL